MYIGMTGHAVCRYGGICCFRINNGTCQILKSAVFWDHKCHFRKEDLDCPNLYDREEKILRMVPRTRNDQIIGTMYNDGLTAKQMAIALGITEKTAQRHIDLLLARMERDDQ